MIIRTINQNYDKQKNDSLNKINNIKSIVYYVNNYIELNAKN